MPYLGKEPWTLARETSRARVYFGKDWSVRPWAHDAPGRRGFVARFRSQGADHVVHVSDDDATVGFLIECLDEIVPLAVLGVASRACGMIDRNTPLREIAKKEGRAYTAEDIAEIVVFTRG